MRIAVNTSISLVTKCLLTWTRWYWNALALISWNIITSYTAIASKLTLWGFTASRAAS